MTKEHKRKISLANMGKRRTEETKRKISLARKGKKRFPFSMEWRKKISESNKGRIGGMLGKHHSKETRKKMREKRVGKSTASWIPRGENHYRWISDRTILVRNQRNDPEYKQWVKKVKKRDKTVCRINNKDCSGYCIAHHILPWRDFPKLRYNINNGITLCQAHHPRKWAEEKRLIPFFQELVPVSSV